MLNQNEEINIKTVLYNLEKELQKFKLEHKASMNEVFKFNPKIMMNLLLNFESFDPTTLTTDSFMPEEKLINFNVGYLKLNFKGKLRLTQDRDRASKTKGRGLVEGPNASYGVVEERDLYLKVDKPVTVKHMYIRPHYSASRRKYDEVPFHFEGYKDGRLIYSSQRSYMQDNRQWVCNI